MYRRAISPYNSRVSNYLEALERDETVSSLRRQYARYRSIQGEYDDLKYEISKAEREKRRLEQKNCEIQEQYMGKIESNKVMIMQLNEKINELKDQISIKETEVEKKQDKNQSTISTIKQKKGEIETVEKQNKDLQKYVEEQEKIIVHLSELLNQLDTKKRQSQSDNKHKSEIIDKQFEKYRKLQEKMKYQEMTRMELKQQLAALKAKRIKLEEKTDQNQLKIKELSKKLEHCEYQESSIEKKSKQMAEQYQKIASQSIELKQNIQKSLKNNKDHSSKLGNLESILKESVNGLCAKHLTKQKLMLELSELVKKIQNAEASITILDDQIVAQEHTHKGLISNLKKSIQSDEQAVKALTRKAAILNMISES